MNELNNISNSLEATLKDSDLQGVSINLAETFSDAILEDGILKDIPLIGTLTGLTKASFSLRERLLVKKLIYFITGLKSIETEKRNKMISKINESGKYKIKVGEKLLYIIDKCEDHISAQYVSDLFHSFLEGEISYDEFLRAASIIQKLLTKDIAEFINIKVENIEISISQYNKGLSDFQNSLITSGICATETDRVTVRDQDDYKINEKYIVEGGDLTVYLTEIGFTLKKILRKSR